jgi:hypothetical protein
MPPLAAHQISVSVPLPPSLPQGGRPGLFLVRFSETNPQNFTLTFLGRDDTTGEVRPKHVLLYNLGSRGFSLRPDAEAHSGDEVFMSISELVKVRTALTD